MDSLSNDNYNGKALMVNSVHDCFWFDMDKSVAEEVIENTSKIMTSIPEHYQEVYGIDVPVMFRVDVEQGPNMKDLH